MTPQTDIFDYQTSAPTHRDDPDTSRAAAKAYAKSGKWGKHFTMLLRAVEMMPDRTACEMAAELVGLDRMQIIRRVAEAIDCGMIERGERRVTAWERRGAYGYRITDKGSTYLHCIKTKEK